jgi:hypothetical protein
MLRIFTCAGLEWTIGRVCLILALILFISAGTSAASDSLNWPREVEVPEATIVIYQPQLETFKDDHLTSRAAVSVTGKEKETPVFGAVWFDARVSTDLDTRMVTVLDVSVTAAKFPEAKPEEIVWLSDILVSEIPNWDMSISLDRLLTGLEFAERQQAAAEALNTTPPIIYFEPQPAILIVLTGDPVLRDIPESTLQRVVNTPYFLVYDPSDKTYYFTLGEYWFSATEVMGPWQDIDSAPQSVADLYQQGIEEVSEEMAEDEQQADTVEGDYPIPKIIVSKEPAELISSVGEPEFASVIGTELLYVSNTENDVFMEIATQLHYVLLSGRWYTSKSLNGPWEYLSADSLPEDFTRIPTDWEKEHVRASIPGTDEAKEAVLETEIPQTAEVDREEATVEVEYDGEPQFEDIEDTDMKYAVNTSYSVIKTGGEYYCCHDAVWFVAPAPTGPWAVCVSVPDVIYTVPPSCPVYNVKYVYVYSYTPTVVYVGYTPGYMGCYVHGGVVVYGTGYYYRPWYGAVYYPRPVTYGFSVRYNPYYGWSFGVSVGGPHVRVTVGWGGGGWWGPPYYRPPYHRPPGYRPPGYRPPGYRPPGYRPPGYRPPGYRPPGYRPPAHGRPPQATPYTGRNMYNNRKDVVRTGGKATTPSTGQATRPATGSVKQPRQSTRPNNVYTDPKGNVYRKTDQGWQQRNNRSWSPSGGSTTGRQTQQNLNRQDNARQRGTTKTQNYRSGRSSSGASRSRSGGGGRRR